MPVPLSLAGFGRWRGPSLGRTMPSATSAARWGGVVVDTILATGRPCFVTVIASPSSTRSMIALALSFSSRMPTVAFSIWPHFSSKWPEGSRAGLWLARPPAKVEDQASDEQHSPENGGPDPDPL